MKIKTKQVIDVSDWDKVVCETYKRPYSFQQQEGCRARGNFYLTIPQELGEDYPSSHEEIPETNKTEFMGVKFEKWLERDPKKPLKDQKYDFELNLWWERNFYPDIQEVANDLHAKGLLPTGEYTINIDW